MICTWMQNGSKRAQSSSFYSLLYLILLSNIWRRLMITGKCIFGAVASRFSDRTTEPMAVFKYLVNCSRIAAVNNLHIKNPNEAADPIIYWLNMLIGLLLPEPNLHMRKGQNNYEKKRHESIDIIYLMRLMLPKTKPIHRPTVPPMAAPIFIFSKVEGSMLVYVDFSQGVGDVKMGRKNENCNTKTRNAKVMPAPSSSNLIPACSNQKRFDRRSIKRKHSKAVIQSVCRALESMASLVHSMHVSRMRIFLQDVLAFSLPHSSVFKCWK